MVSRDGRSVLAPRVPPLQASGQVLECPDFRLVVAHVQCGRVLRDDGAMLLGSLPKLRRPLQDALAPGTLALTAALLSRVAAG